VNYSDFLDSKRQLGGNHGFEPVWTPDFLYDFQTDLTAWAIRKGRAAIFADCGLGKTPMQLVWAENVVRHTGKRVLILTPLAVSAQTQREAEKFGIEAAVSRDGSGSAPITITNYERLHYFSPSDFVGVVCDESSILKNFDGSTRKAITEFMRLLPFRLLCTATAAPNDYMEIGTSSEALGYLGQADMLTRFFRRATKIYIQHEAHSGEAYRLRPHAKRDFWRWVCSWARAVRKPSDMGYEDNGFKLPELVTRNHVVTARTRRDDCLFDLPAVGLQEQRKERRRTLNERCEMAASLVNKTGKPAVCWCHLNDEGDTLTGLIPDAVQVSGGDSDEFKERTFEDFAAGRVRVLVTKPTIAGFGLNWQHCAHQTFFPSHSFEQWYQAVRRSWRFGQKRPVTVDVVTSEGEADVLANMQRKSDAADAMFANLVSLMHDSLRVDAVEYGTEKIEAPTWLTSYSGGV
jgi:hypothetical protein